MKGWGWGADPLGFATRITSSGFAPPGFLLRACRRCAARSARPAHPPDSLRLPRPPEPRLSGGWSSVPTAAPLGASGASRWPGGPAVTWPRSARRGPRSSAGLSLASRVKPGLQAAPGPGSEGTCPARGNARTRESLRPPPRRERTGETQEKGKHARGRADRARRLPRNRHLRRTQPGTGAAGRAGSEVRARPPARRSAPLTREPAAPLAVPAAPLQDEVAVALLSHPELQSVLQQHLLGLEPHRSGPAAPAGPGSHRPGSRAEPARKEAAGNAACERPALRSPGSAAGAAHPGSPRSPRAGPALGPPPVRPRHAHRLCPAHPAGSLGDVLISESWRLQAVPEWREEVRSWLLPASSPALAGGAGAPLPSSAPAGRQSGEQQQQHEEEKEEMGKKASCCHSCRLPT